MSYEIFFGVLNGSKILDVGLTYEYAINVSPSKIPSEKMIKAFMIVSLFVQTLSSICI